MADTFNKKALQQRKEKKRKEKLEQRNERKLNNNKGKGLDDMIAYVDAFGNLTSEPVEATKREEIKLEDIQLGAAPIINSTKEFTGKVVSFMTEKGFGFIAEDNSNESIFVHINRVEEPIAENDRVIFEKERTPKGFAAINVRKL